MLRARDLVRLGLEGHRWGLPRSPGAVRRRVEELTGDPVEAGNLCLMGTTVTSGTATGVVVATSMRHLLRLDGRFARR